MTAPDPAAWADSSLAGALRQRYTSELQAPEGHTARMGAVQARYGSNRASARAVGVDERTWRRWLAGTRPRAATAGRLADVAARVRADSISAHFRRLHVDQHMGRDTRSRVIDARGLNYNRSGDDVIAGHVRAKRWGHAAAAFIAAIRDSQYARLLTSALDESYGLTVTGIDI